MSDFVKRTDTGFATQLENFAVKLPNYATLLNITAGEIATAQDDAQVMGAAVVTIEQSKTYGQGCVAFKDLVRYGGPGSLSAFPVAATPPVISPTA